MAKVKHVWISDACKFYLGYCFVTTDINMLILTKSGKSNAMFGPMKTNKDHIEMHSKYDCSVDVVEVWTKKQYESYLTWIMFREKQLPRYFKPVHLHSLFWIIIKGKTNIFTQSILNSNITDIFT